MNIFKQIWKYNKTLLEPTRFFYVRIQDCEAVKMKKVFNVDCFCAYLIYFFNYYYSSLTFCERNKENAKENNSNMYEKTQ